MEYRFKVHFRLEGECPGETIPGNQFSRFGFCVENGDFEKAVRRIKKLTSLELVGLHGHNSTRTKSLNIVNELSGKSVNKALNDYEDGIVMIKYNNYFIKNIKGVECEV